MWCLRFEAPPLQHSLVSLLASLLCCCTPYSCVSVCVSSAIHRFHRLLYTHLLHRHLHHHFVGSFVRISSFKIHSYTHTSVHACTYIPTITLVLRYRKEEEQGRSLEYRKDSFVCCLQSRVVCVCVCHTREVYTTSHFSERSHVAQSRR